MMDQNKVVVGLVKGRHDMPVQEYIFDEIEDVLDFKAMEERITLFIWHNIGVDHQLGCGINQVDYTDVMLFQGKKNLVVYVTGLTAAVAELISICAKNGVSLTLMHYDRDTDSYKEQKIF